MAIFTKRREVIVEIMRDTDYDRERSCPAGGTEVPIGRRDHSNRFQWANVEASETRPSANRVTISVNREDIV